METINLQLFEQNTHVPENSVRVKEVLPEKQPQTPLKSLEQTLSSIFPDNQEENKVNKARKILGETVISYSDEQLAGVVTDFEYLIDCWLDLFEKQTFEGKTLRELLGTSVYEHTK